MSTFRFTGQPLSGTPQRPFVMPPQMMLTPAPACFVASHPSMLWRPPPDNSVPIMQRPPNHIMPPPAPFTMNFSQPPPLPPQALNTQVPVTATADYPPRLMDVNLDRSFPATGSTSKRSPQSVSKNPDSSSGGHPPPRFAAKSNQCGAGIAKVKDVADKRSTDGGNTVDFMRSQWPETSDFCPSVSSLRKKNNSVSSAVSTSTTAAPASSSDHGKCVTGLSSVSAAKPTSSVSASASSLSVSAPLFQPNAFKGSKHSTATERNRKSSAGVTAETGCKPVNEAGGKTSGCTTVKDSVTVLSSAGSFHEFQDIAVLSFSVAAPLFQPNAFNGSKRSTPTESSRKSDASVTAETGREPVSEAGGKTSACTTVKDSVTVISSTGSFSEFRDSVAPVSSPSSSSLSSSLSQPVTDAVSPPAFGRGKKLMQQLTQCTDKGSARPTAGGLFILICIHYASAQHSEAEGIMFLCTVHLSVCAFLCASTHTVDCILKLTGCPKLTPTMHYVTLIFGSKVGLYQISAPAKSCSGQISSSIWRMPL